MVVSLMIISNFFVNLFLRSLATQITTAQTPHQVFNNDV